MWKENNDDFESQLPNPRSLIGCRVGMHERERDMLKSPLYSGEVCEMGWDGIILLSFWLLSTDHAITGFVAFLSAVGYLFSQMTRMKLS
jgi:hypothetical protein